MITDLVKRLIIESVPLLALICFFLLQRKNRIPEKTTWSINVILLVYSCYSLIIGVYLTISVPQIWDFTCFYLWGNVASAGYDFYLPESSRDTLELLNLPFSNIDVFITQIVNVGFYYPPQTMLYFIPLAYFDYNNALLIWTFFNFVFLLLDIALSYQLFFKKKGLSGLFLVVILFFIFSGVKATFHFSQTNFIALFFLLMMRKNSNSEYGGIFLTLATFTKPYLIVFSLYYILMKKWKALWYAILSASLITGISLFFFGPGTFISYFLNNPVKNRMPEFVYFEEYNQSLNAILYRSGLVSENNKIVFYVFSGLILIFALMVILYLVKRRYNDKILGIILLVALMLYPSTWGHYSLMLLFLMSEFVDNTSDSKYARSINLFIFFSIFYLAQYSLFISLCLLLILMSMKVYYLENSKNKPSSESGQQNLTRST